MDGTTVATGGAEGPADGRTEPDEVCPGRADGSVGRAGGTEGDGRALGAARWGPCAWGPGALVVGMEADVEALDEWGLGEAMSAAGTSDPFELFEKATMLNVILAGSTLER